MITLHLTDHERAAGQVTPATLDAACRAIRDDGFVVLDRVVDPDHIAVIRDSMRADALGKIEAADGEAKRHIQQHPPRDADALFEDVFSNPFGMQIAEAVIGPSITLDFYESNTNLPGSEGQRLHVDMSPRKDGDPVGEPCRCMVLNIPLVDFTLENGATEVWPGTHTVPCEIGERWVGDEQQIERAQVQPPEQAVMTAGSLLLRDIRLWHRGVPNHSQVIRTMIAMIVNGNFDREHGDRSKLAQIGIFPASYRSFFAGLRVVTNPTFDDDPPPENYTLTPLYQCATIEVDLPLGVLGVMVRLRGSKANPIT